jgi:hypothetical protein
LASLGLRQLQNGIVYAGCCDSAFCALNATDGALIWNFTDTPSGSGTMEASFPGVADGVVYVGPSDGKLYALMLLMEKQFGVSKLNQFGTTILTPSGVHQLWTAASFILAQVTAACIL